MVRYRFILFNVFIFISFFGYNQQTDTDIKLANSYFQDGDFEKSVMYFEKLEQESSLLPKIYHYYRSALMELGRYKNVEKLCKSYLKYFPERLSIYVDLGELYKYLENDKKSESYFDKPIDLVNELSSYEVISEVGISYERNNDLSRALTLYQKANNLNKQNPFAFHTKMANVLSKQGQYQQMINLYLELLKVNESYLLMVQSGLSNHIDFETQLSEKELIRKTLLKKIQANSKNVVYVKLLIWYYLLNQDFNGAFQQVIALDRKLNKDGLEVLNLGKTALNNQSFEIALDCFDYVINNSKSDEKKYTGETLKLKTLKQKLIFNQIYNPQELLALKSSYLKTLYKLDQNATVIRNVTERKYEVLLDLAELEAYYLNDTDEAKNHLQKALNLNGISQLKKGKVNMLLADLFVLENKIWEASLLYLKVEKQFKEDPLGHQAKFNNAKVYYYAGEFDWCQAQLDVLKASTSKLIANDALALSVLITDNYNMDTSEVAMKLFAIGDMYVAQKKYSEALRIYDSIYNQFQNHSLNDDILFRKSQVFKIQQMQDKAIDALKQLEEEFPGSIILDKALLSIAKLYEEDLNDFESAKKYYRKILFDHPSSLYVIDARKRFRKLSGKTNQNINKSS